MQYLHLKTQVILIKRIAFIVLITLGFVACEDLEYSPVPDVTVSCIFYLNDIEFIDFGHGSSMIIPEDSTISYDGYAGIMLYRVNDDYIHAYDACCPIHYEDKELLTVDGAAAMCPTDSVYWPIYLGEPAYEMDNDINPVILKSYHTYKQGETLQVTN